MPINIIIWKQRRSHGSNYGPENYDLYSHLPSIFFVPYSTRHRFTKHCGKTICTNT